MLQNYLKIALRNLRRNKLYSLINITGFALGLACCLAILLWVNYQWSFNRFNEKLDRIYRVLRVQKVSNAVNVYRAMAGPFVETVKADIPELEQVAQALDERNSFAVGNNIFREDGVYGNSDIFSVFSFPLLSGNANTIADEPNTVALSETLARKLFGTTDALGKTVRLDAKSDVKVSGVFRDIPKNSSFRFEYVLPLKQYIKENEWAQQWGSNAFEAFVLLKEGASQNSIDARLKDFLQRKTNTKDTQFLFTQPLSTTYLYNKYENGIQQGGRIETVRIFITIAAMVLLLACVNFMNLTSARGLRRSKELGIRKTVGATRTKLIAQMLGESVITALLAIPFAIILVEFSLPLLKELTGATLQIPFSNLWFWLVMPFVGFVVGVLSGLYPALALSSHKTVNVLKGTMKTGPGAILMRRGLVVFEFTVAVAFIVATIVLYQQIEFIKIKNLGIDRENVVAVPVDIPADRFNAWKSELKANPAIVNITGTGGQSPLRVGNNTSGMRWRGQQANEQIMVGFFQGDYSFLETMGIQLKEGRGFSANFPADSVNYIVNETCVQQMRLAKPLGETLQWGIGPNAQSGTIVGVVKDFHFANMHQTIDPMMIVLAPRPDRILVRLAKGRTEEGLKLLQNTFAKYQPGQPFDYKFLDAEFDEMYKSETMMSRLTLIFAGLAVVICCLGLLGLAAFMAETRTKEIGVRKVLGASAASIVGLLSKDFLKLVALAILLATPLAYWGMGKWLQSFAYRIDLSWWIFAVAGVGAVGIAFITVAGQALRAAQANPVQSLRSE
ncbi:MAG: ABC transporter permease [Candidatus Kapabacteria bacterium]|jgi:predicted permease|nr:ABC transporter permease [Candidatus Kapabacteria bacterium]